MPRNDDFLRRYAKSGYEKDSQSQIVELLLHFGKRKAATNDDIARESSKKLKSGQKTMLEVDQGVNQDIEDNAPLVLWCTHGSLMVHTWKSQGAHMEVFVTHIWRSLRYPHLSEEKILDPCSFWHGNCNFNLCLLSKNEVCLTQMPNIDCNDDVKLHHLHYLIKLLLSFL